MSKKSKIYQLKVADPFKKQFLNFQLESVEYSDTCN